MKCYAVVAVLLLAVSLSNNASASNVRWNYLNLALEHSYSDAQSLYSTTAQPAIFFMTYVDAAMSIMVEGFSYEGVEYESSWVTAERGDVCNAEYIDGKGAYFSKTDMENSYGTPYGRSDYSILIANDQTLCLAFSTRDFYSPNIIKYGWVALANSGGVLQLANSAIDLDGDSIVVGQMPEPEPAAGMLAALGLAALMLRRRFGR